ncbi:MAG: DUF3841 domain-containing protein [Pseudomonadota bacterium]|nr:DUF3841 domain-containing protein [Pseudomonadota bacterium]
MKLVTFQTPKALSILQKTGILIADTSYIDMKKSAVPYNWIVQEMNKKKIRSQNGERYPIWAWAKCGAFSAPRKRKNYFETQQKKLIKITFEKPDNEVLLSDYMAYSFVLSGHIIPKTKEEYRKFLQKNEFSLSALKGFVRQDENGKTVAKLFPKIEKTWPRMFHLKSNIWQACVWNIKLSEVIKIEVLNDQKYLFGSMNPKRKNGTRPNWKKSYLKFLK